LVIVLILLLYFVSPNIFDDFFIKIYLILRKFLNSTATAISAKLHVWGLHENTLFHFLFFFLFITVSFANCYCQSRLNHCAVARSELRANEFKIEKCWSKLKHYRERWKNNIGENFIHFALVCCRDNGGSWCDGNYVSHSCRVILNSFHRPQSWSSEDWNDSNCEILCCYILSSFCAKSTQVWCVAYNIIVLLFQRAMNLCKFALPSLLARQSVQFSSVQFIDSMPQLNDRMTEQICRQWKRTKRHQSALTIALKLGLKH